MQNLMFANQKQLKNYGEQWLKSELIQTITYFNSEGMLLLSQNRTGASVQTTTPDWTKPVYLSDQSLNRLRVEDNILFLEWSEQKRVTLIVTSKIRNLQKKTIGYVEQVHVIDQKYIKKISQRFKIEWALLSAKSEVLMSSHDDLLLYKDNFFQNYLKEGTDFFDLNIRNETYGFLIYPTKVQDIKLSLGIAISKKEAKSALRNVNVTFISVIAILILLIVLSIVFITHVVLKPMNELLEALQSVQFVESGVTIPIKSDTEIGLLTESINELVRKISIAQNDLNQKIKELEFKNSELKDAQTKLVQTAKMMSLGQLVAGVAHELNNPISFIYSNMSLLKDYSDKLVQLAIVAETDPARIPQLKIDLDIDYILKDLPKLIGSCEDGARRTREIVMGLRSFSRIEEGTFKEANLHEGIESTLALLVGETKNRIEINKKFGDIPPVYCNVSQINQVFMNILSNAVHAMNSNGTIEIQTKYKRYDKNPHVSISIKDSGQGMSPEVLDKIFDPFFTTKGVGQGTGLGLSISYGIIEAHGGSIEAKSELGVGTEFIIRLPIRRSSQNEKL